MAVQRKKAVKPQIIEVEAETVNETAVQVIDFTSLTPANVSEVENLKKEIDEVIDANPFIEITDNKTYEKAKGNRKNILDVAIKVEKQDTFFGSFFRNFRNQLKEVLIGDEDGLNKKPREKYDVQDAEVKRWEKIKDEERIERERIAKEREDRIVADIDAAMIEITEIADGVTFTTIDEIESEMDVAIGKHKGTFEEFDVIFDESVDQLKAAFALKVKAARQAHEQAEESRKAGIENKIRDIDANVKTIILDATVENMEAAAASVKAETNPDFDFMEFTDTFKAKARELNAMWQRVETKLKSEIADAAERKEMEDFRFEKRSPLLFELGMVEDQVGTFVFQHENGSFEITRPQIVSGSNEDFSESLSYLKTKIESINELAVDVANGNDYSAETTFDNGEIVDQKITMSPGTDSEQETFEKEMSEFGTRVETEMPSEEPMDFVAKAARMKAGSFGAPAEPKAEEAPAMEQPTTKFEEAIAKTAETSNAANAQSLGNPRTVGEMVDILLNVDPSFVFEQRPTVLSTGQKIRIVFPIND